MPGRSSWASAVNERYSLAYSPCPNDTYVFAALANGLLDGAPRVDVAFHDVETLNLAAQRGTYELTKVSYGAIPHLLDRYRILRAGGALGRGCGPLVLARPEPGYENGLAGFPRDATVAIPGRMTTGFVLLRLALGYEPRVVEMRFDRIMDAVRDGSVDAGVVVHESRFTYRDAGLVSVVDLGKWWESETGAPIPLGAILVRRDVGDADAQELGAAIRRSLAFARNDEPQIIDYVRAHAFEMDDDAMRGHIGLYVNELTDDLGDAGIAAVETFFSRARAAGLLPAERVPEFV